MCSCKKKRSGSLPAGIRGQGSPERKMEKFYGILNVALPVITMLAAGILIRKKQYISEKGIEDIKFFALNFCLPAALFKTFMTTRLTRREGVLLLVMAGAMLAAFLLGKVVTGLLRIPRKSAPFLCCTTEGGGVGFPLYVLLFGQDELYHLAILDTGGAFLQWPVIMTMFTMLGRGKQSMKETLRSLVTPINISILSGILFSVTGAGAALAGSEAGKAVIGTLDFVSQPTAPILIMTVGYGLKLGEVRWAEIGRAMLARVIVMAIMAACVLMILQHIFPGDQLFRNAVLIYYILPPTYAYSAMIRGGEDEAFVGTFLPVYTLLTILAFIILSGILI